VVAHPPIDESLRAFAYRDETRPAQAYLQRDRDIVDESLWLIGLPKEDSESTLGGTWYTIRYARQTNTNRLIVWPDGSVSINDREPVWNWRGIL
jgi:hypothetical protein